MKFTIQNKARSLTKAEAILVFARLKNNKVDFDEFFSRLSKDQQGVVKSASIKAGEGKTFRFEKNPVLVHVVVEKIYNEKNLSLVIRKFTALLKRERLESALIYIDDLEKDNLSSEKATEVIIKNAILAHYDFSQEFKAKPKEGWPLVKEITLLTHHEAGLLTNIIKEAEIVANAVNACRTLCNYPPSHLSPDSLAEAAKTASKNISNLTVKVFDEKKLKAEGMNGILAVGSGSINPPRLVIMEYKGGKDGQKPLALVGKGITFDSGGINTKPAEYMGDMHMDMSGGASVIYAIEAIAKLKLPVNVIGFIPAAENMPGGKSFRMHDIITAYGGKTIEVGHTDAEGRVVLADAIEYAKTKKPALVVTIATLTGAVVVALGQRFSGLFVKDNLKLRLALEKIGQDSGDLVWPLPLTKENENEVKGNLADFTNTHKNNSRYGGASSAAGFLSNFAGTQPFVHIDMAPRMVAMPDEESLPKGAVGFGVAYFVELAKQWPALQETLLRQTRMRNG